MAAYLGFELKLNCLAVPHLAFQCCGWVCTALAHWPRHKASQSHRRAFECLAAQPPSTLCPPTPTAAAYLSVASREATLAEVG